MGSSFGARNRCDYCDWKVYVVTDWSESLRFSALLCFVGKKRALMSSLSFFILFAMIFDIYCSSIMRLPS